MLDNLHGLLESNDPVALLRIEKALHAYEADNETVDTILSALIWRRCTAGRSGLLGAVLDRDCAARVSVMPDHLDLVGAKDAAQALRDLREEIPLPDEEIRNGLIDWVDGNPGFVQHAADLDDGLADVAPKVWSFMQVHQGQLPDPVIPEKNKGLLSRLFRPSA